MQFAVAFMAVARNINNVIKAAEQSKVFAHFARNKVPKYEQQSMTPARE
jgi:hypothetical protein